MKYFWLTIYRHNSQPSERGGEIYLNSSLLLSLLKNKDFTPKRVERTEGVHLVVLGTVLSSAEIAEYNIKLVEARHAEMPESMFRKWENDTTKSFPYETWESIKEVMS